MSTSQTKYAIDLSNEGVALWHRDEEKHWVLLGKVALDAPNFSDDIESLKNGHASDDKTALVARVRIPRSEVFVSQIDLSGSHDDAVKEKVARFLNEKTPYSSDELFYDLDHKTGNNTSHIAAVTKQTISEAKEFVTGHGFEAAYYTTKFDKADFPRDARFYDGTPSPVVAVDQVAPEPEKTKAADPSETDFIPTPPPPKPLPTPKVIEPLATGKKLIEEPPEAEKTDLSAFETVRSKKLVAPKKHEDKKEHSLSKTAISAPAPRLSIDMTEADAKRPPEKNIGLMAAHIKTPQGKTAKDGIKSKLKTRHILILMALLLAVLAYWFLTTLFDGKEEIARLNELPTPEAVVETTPEIIVEAPALAETIVEPEPPVETDAIALSEATPEVTEPSVGEAPVDLAVETPIPEPDTQTAEATIDASAKDPEASIEPTVEKTVDVETTIAETAPAELEVIAEATPEIVEPATTQDTPEDVTQAPAIEEITAESQTEVAAVTSEELPTAESTPAETDIETPLADLIPTKDGTLGAEGITLFSGVPDIIPPVREQLNISPDPLKDILPKMRSNDFAEIHKAEIEANALALAQETNTDIPEIEDAAVTDQADTVNEDTVETVKTTPAEPDLLALADPALKSIQPRARPTVIAERVKEIAAAALAPPADPTLAGLKPRQRPGNLRIVKEEVQPEQVDPSEIQVAIQEAVRDIARPRARPNNLSRKVANIKAAEKEATKTESVQTAALTPKTARGTSKASSTTAASVQRQATERNGINKRRISLIGVYGKASSRRALVRMPSGRYVKVKSGQKFSGWKVSAIGESSVRITKGSRNQVLRMPKN